jgi:hypothetical protein
MTRFPRLARCYCDWELAAFIGCLLCVVSTGVEAATTNVRAYRIDATFQPSAQSMSAEAQVEFADAPGRDPTDRARELVFYLHDGLEVLSIKVGNRSVDFRQNKVPYDYNYTTKATRVVVPLDVSAAPVHDMTVSYAGTFSASDARSPSDYMRIDADGVLLRSYGYSLWFPVFLEAGKESEPVTFPEVTIRVPEAFTPVFVGNRVADERTDGQRVSRWRADGVDLFAAQLTARRFVITSGGGIHLYHEDNEASRKSANSIVDYVKRLHELYAAHYNPARRFEQVHVMEMPRYGDISSGNVVGISGDVWRQFETNQWAKRALAHEFVHPFVQVPTKRSDPLFALMIEGFPSYFHLPILAELEGEDFYDEFLNRIENSYLEKRKSGKDGRGNPLPPEKPLYDIKPDEVGLYKDVFVLGDRALLFFDFLRRQPEKANFSRFTRELFAQANLDHAAFEALIRGHFALSAEDLSVWLRSNEYPDRFHRKPGNRP